MSELRRGLSFERKRRVLEQHNTERNYATLQESSSRYDIMDSSIQSFALDFRGVLPGGARGYSDFQTEGGPTFRDYIERTLGSASGRPMVAIEFGGPGSQLFRGFTPGFFDKTVGVCLQYKEEPVNAIEKAKQNHTVMVGNIFDTPTYGKVRQLIGDREVGLIISRMAGPLRDVTDSPRLLARILSKWYKLLTHEPGLMFVQFPESDRLYAAIHALRQYVTNNFYDTLEMQVSYKIFRLLKKAGAPVELPLLPRQSRKREYYS